MVGLAVTKVGAAKAGHLSRRPFLSEERRAAADTASDEEAARIIFKALCMLRGTALKAAQLIALEMEWLPEAYQKELAKSFSEVAPMNRVLVRKVIRTALGPPEQVFESFEPVPFAAASLGQVHRAVGPDGRALAVKVQYPGIAAGVRSDIDLLRVVLTPTKYARIFQDCFTEIAARISEELDYRLEAEHTRRFAEQIDFERYIIPSVVPSLSAETVLSVTLLGGRHLEPWLASNPTQDQRDHFGKRLFDLFEECTHGSGLIHADPNPGNFLFQADGRLGIIDFGCVKAVEPEFVAAMDRLRCPDTPVDPETLEQLHNRIGVHYRQGKDKAALNDFLVRWIQWIREPYKTEFFDFSGADDYFRRGTELVKVLYRHIDRYDGAFAYFGRTQHGLFRLLQKLGARVRLRPQH